MYKRIALTIALSAICLAGCKDTPQSKQDAVALNSVKVILTAQNSNDRLAEKQPIDFTDVAAAVLGIMSLSAVKDTALL